MTKNRIVAIGLGLAAVGSLSACNPQQAFDTVIGQNPSYNGQPCPECDGPDSSIRVLDTSTGLCFTIGAKYAALHGLELTPCPD